ncbi:MAG: hypothetical protein AAFQ24_10925, partial [Pseudomonadota bacterium]
LAKVLRCPPSQALFSISPVERRASALGSAMITHAGTVLVWVAATFSVYTLGLYVGAVIADVKRPR